MAENLSTLLDNLNQPLPEKIEYAIRHLIATVCNESERICRLNTAIELIESHVADLGNSD